MIMKTAPIETPIETPKKPKRPKKFKSVRKLIWLSLCSLMSGLCFGIGYTIIDHADSTWFQAEEKSPPQAIATSDR